MVKQLLIYVRWWDNMINWMKGRLTERTSLDGAVLIGTALAILLAAPLLNVAAWIALVYGIWSIIKEE